MSDERTKLIALRVTPTEHAAITRNAARDDTTISAIVRDALTATGALTYQENPR